MYSFIASKGKLLFFEFIAVAEKTLISDKGDNYVSKGVYFKED